MKKQYIAPSMKVRRIETEAMMAASGNGLNAKGGTWQQDFSDPVDAEEVDASTQALSNHNPWTDGEDNEWSL